MVLIYQIKGREMSNNGGIATAKISRKKALNRYYENPSICRNCGKIIVVRDGEKVQYARRKSFCNQKCHYQFHIENKTGIHSDSLFNKAGVKRSPLPEETKAKISKAMKGRIGKPLSDEHKIKFREGRMKAGTSIQMKQKLSIHACSNKHKFNNFKHVPFIPYTRLNGTVTTLRGTYEIRFAKYLDGIGLEWQYAKPISFIDTDGVKRHMLPDFFIESTGRYFDTKGYLSKQCSDRMEFIRKQKGIAIQLIFLKDIESLESGEKNLEDF